METTAYSFTIIIPHYNIPQLLRRCLRSVPQRDDVQVVIVDDNSTGDAASELKAVEAEFPQHTFLHLSQNGGGGHARNAGLDKALGRYVLFADADDFFNECISDIFDDYKDADYDQIYFKANSTDTDTSLPAHRADHLNQYIDNFLNGTDADGCQLRYLFGEPWARMVKRSMIAEQGIRFEETTIHNDTAFGYLTGYHAQSIHADERQLYCVTVRQGSVSVTTSIDRIITRVEVFARAERFLRQHGVSTIPIAHYEQLAKLVRYRQFSTFSKGVTAMRATGFSRFHIYSRVCYKLWLMIKFKIFKS